MGYRLKSRQLHVPGSFQVLFPEIGQQKPTTGSFETCVQFALGVVKGNPILAKKHGWAQTREWAEGFVEMQNVARCAARGWFNFLVSDEAIPDPPPHRDIPGEENGSKKNASVAGALKGLRHVSAGVGLLIDWLGDGGKPVEHKVAVGRALICSTCPQNNGGDWKSVFTKPIADKIRKQLEMKAQMQLVTPHDSTLQVCSACSCPLLLKAHVPLTHILNHTSEEVRSQLAPGCWILSEEKASQTHG